MVALVLLDITSFLRSVVVVEGANYHDSMWAAALTAGFKAGDILLADRGYVDFGFLLGLEDRRAFFVTRQRGPLKYEVKERREVSGHVIPDEIIVLTGDESREKYAKPLRRIFAVVELNGQPHDMVFLTNSLDWAAETICEPYRARWEHRGVLQGAQADAPVRGLHRLQWECGEVAGRIGLVETLIPYGAAGPEEKRKLRLEQACFKGFEDPEEKPVGQKKRRKPRKRGVGKGRR